MSDNYNDVHLHDERDDGGRRLAEEADFLHDWRISLDKRLGITNTKRLYELLGRVVAIDEAIKKMEREHGWFMDNVKVDVALQVGDVRLARELLR